MALSLYRLVVSQSTFLSVPWLCPSSLSCTQHLWTLHGVAQYTRDKNRRTRARANTYANDKIQRQQPCRQKTWATFHRLTYIFVVVRSLGGETSNQCVCVKETTTARGITVSKHLTVNDNDDDDDGHEQRWLKSNFIPDINIKYLHTHHICSFGLRANKKAPPNRPNETHACVVWRDRRRDHCCISFCVIALAVSGNGKSWPRRQLPRNRPDFAADIKSELIAHCQRLWS